MPTKTCVEKIRDLLKADAECLDGKLSAEEKGCKFVIEKPKGSNEDFCRIKFDGCVCPKGQKPKRCDYIFYRCTTNDVYFVELKRQKIKDAIEQIGTSITLAKPILEHKENKIFGFVISNKCPLASTDIQNEKEKFRDKYGGKLEIHSSRKWVHKVK